MTWLLHSLSRAVTWLAQIGDAAGAGYLVQMLLQKIKATLGVIDASVSGMCFGSHPSNCEQHCTHHCKQCLLSA